MKKLTLLTGLPNAGKSTYTKSVLEENKNIAVISRDNILEQFGRDKYGVEAYSEIWSKLTPEDQKEIDDILNNKINDIAEKGLEAIVDMTMLTPMVREKMINNFPGYSVECVAFVVAWDELLKRNRERYNLTGKLIPEDVLRSMWTRYEIPDKKEHPSIKRVQVIVQ